MKIIRLQASGIKRLVAVDITPAPGVNRVGGFNGEGKTSLLDSIAMAFGGADEIPMKPLRTGEEYGVVRITTGTGDEAALKVTRYFSDDGTTSLKVQSADGATYDKGQTKASEIIGAISFDPIRFADMEEKARATELRRLVPLEVNLDKLAADDKLDLAARRDVNRDAKALLARVEAVNVSGIVPEVRPDRAAIVADLSGAAGVNATIERERGRRENKARRLSGEKRFEDERETEADRRTLRAGELRVEAQRLDESAAILLQEARDLKTAREAAVEELAVLPALDAPVDTTAVSAKLADADRDLALLDRIAERDRLKADHAALVARSEGYTAAVAKRAEERATALASAKMPVEGLSIARLCDAVAGETSEELIVTFNGEPFSQASRAEQIRVSMRIAMAANPKLRVMTIRDGSLLDERGFKLISEIAAEGDYQVFVEVVGEGDENGIIIEDGRVKGAPDPERVEAPRKRKAKAAGEAEQIVEANAPHLEGHARDLATDVAQEAVDKASPPVVEALKKPKPRAMREFSSAKPGDLFGGDK